MSKSPDLPQSQTERVPLATRHSPEQVALARQMYLDGTPVAQIRKACEMSQAELYYWLDGGPKAGERHLEPLPRRSAGRKPPAPRRASTGNRAKLVGRLWRAAEAQVREIEVRLRRHQQQPDERERDARSLAVLVKTLRELSALDATTEGTAAKADTDHDDAGPRDIDEFRRELARRMDEIVAARAADVPGEAQGR